MKTAFILASDLIGLALASIAGNVILIMALSCVLAIIAGCAIKSISTNR